MEGLGTPKTLKNQRFFNVFAVVRFRYFRALDAPLWPILAPLGPIWSQNGSQNGFPHGSKSSKDPPLWRSVGTVPGSWRVPKSLIFIVKNRVLGARGLYLGDQEAQSQEAGAILKALVSKMAPRRLKTSPNSPR